MTAEGNYIVEGDIDNKSEGNKKWPSLSGQILKPFMVNSQNENTVEF